MSRSLERRAAAVLGDRVPPSVTALWFYRVLRREIRAARRAGRLDADPVAAARTLDARAGVLNAGVGPHHVHVDIDLPYATQRPAEFSVLLERLQALRPERVCEIGTNRGGTLWYFSRVCADDGTVVTIDRCAPFYTRSLRRHVGKPRQTIASLEADSQAPATLERVKKLLGGPLDFLFIDGDHSYAGVRRDFELYAPLVRTGGLIALHDINAGGGDGRPRDGQSWAGDVPRFWSEISAGRDVEELVAAPGEVGYGIGLIRM